MRSHYFDLDVWNRKKKIILLIKKNTRILCIMQQHAATRQWGSTPLWPARTRPPISTSSSWRARATPAMWPTRATPFSTRATPPGSGNGAQASFFILLVYYLPVFWKKKRAKKKNKNQTEIPKLNGNEYFHAWKTGLLRFRNSVLERTPNLQQTLLDWTLNPRPLDLKANTLSLRYDFVFLVLIIRISSDEAFNTIKNAKRKW